MRPVLVYILLFFCLTSSAFSQLLNPQVDSIPMRDNKKLAADVYLPNGGTAQLPTILIQTPYNRLYYRFGLPLGIGIQIDQCNYNIVILDWRGSFGSSQAYVPQPNRGYDGYDAVEWIATQPWSDGNVGTWGPSALGKVQYLTAKEDPPHLKCIVPVVAAPYYNYSEYYPGGVLRTEYVEQLDQLGFGLGLLVYPHPFYDIVWQYTESTSNYPQSIKVPCFMVGGWYDHNINEMVDFFASIRSSSPLAVRDKHKLLIGPWAHGGHSIAYVGSLQQGELTYPVAEGWSDSLAMMFFDYYLRSQPNGWESNNYIMYYLLGKEEWANSASWPPAGLQEISYFVNAFVHTHTIPTSYCIFGEVHFPSDPSPTHGGATLRTDLLQGPYDQSVVVESRADALVITSDVFAEPLYIFGKPVVTLQFHTNRKDIDLAVRLCDVYPDGRSMLLSDGIKRCRFLNGYTTADTASLVPGDMYEAKIELSELAQVFMPGHSLRITITGSNYPRYDVNLNNGGTMYTAGDTLVAQTNIISSFYDTSKITFQGYFLSSASSVTSESPETIFPNPANDIIYFDGFSGSQKWKIFDISGKEIAGFTTFENNSYDISFLAPGVYSLFNEPERMTFKIIRLND